MSVMTINARTAMLPPQNILVRYTASTAMISVSREYAAIFFISSRKFRLESSGV